jgi:Holliday junction resolvasome RuvABC ATP-dependent DNA helicase subunit
MTNDVPKESIDSPLGSGDTRLVPIYTFEEFIVGPHNRFPHAASLAVSENLGKAYNPLFLYGPVGIGKTHLMQSVGHRVIQRDPKSRVLYVTAQQFMTEVIELLQAGKLQTLRERYRALDLLLVDDIQFLATSEATQEEFFHIFNDLHASGKQIIMTSDRPPKMLTTLEDRLRSRFEWGLIADIKLTNLETRVAILKKKEGHLQGMHLADDIRVYIASRLKSNIRELEGFLRRIQAYTQLYNEEVTLSLVKEILKELLPPEEWVHENDGKSPSPEGDRGKSSLSFSKKVLEEMEGFDLQPAPISGPKSTPASEAPPSPPAESSQIHSSRREASGGSPKQNESPVVSPKLDSAEPPLKNSASPVPPLLKKPEHPPVDPASVKIEPQPSPPPEIKPVTMPTTPRVPEHPSLPQPKPDTSVGPSVPPDIPSPVPTPGMPRIPMPQVPMPKVNHEAPAAPPIPLPKHTAAPVSLTPVAGSGKGGQSSGSIPATPGQIPVVFFYPTGHDKELVQMKRKFDDIINKHKLKFVLHPALEVDYTPSATISMDLFIEKCQQAGVSIGVVLAPSPDAALQEGVFFNSLQEAFDQANLSLQMVPWDELGKDYRFLNLALDITLIRIKQRKS